MTDSDSESSGALNSCPRDDNTEARPAESGPSWHPQDLPTCSCTGRIGQPHPAVRLWGWADLTGPGVEVQKLREAPSPGPRWGAVHFLDLGSRGRRPWDGPQPHSLEDTHQHPAKD